jgi:hypothetical protein
MSSTPSSSSSVDAIDGDTTQPPERSSSPSTPGAQQPTPAKLNPFRLSLDSSSGSSLNQPPLLSEEALAEPLETPILDLYYRSSGHTALAASLATQEEWTEIEREASREQQLQLHHTLAHTGQEIALDMLGVEGFHTLRTTYPEQWAWVVLHCYHTAGDAHPGIVPDEPQVVFRNVYWFASARSSLSDAEQEALEPLSPKSQPSSSTPAQPKPE